MKYTDTNSSAASSTSFALFLAIAASFLLAFVPGEATGQTTCYAVSGGNWDDPDNWSSVSGGDPATDPCNDPVGYPDSDSYAADIESGAIVQNIPTLEVADVTVRSSSNGLVLSEDFTVTGNVIVESNTVLNTYVVDGTQAVIASGSLVVNGSMDNSGTFRVDRESGGNGSAEIRGDDPLADGVTKGLTSSGTIEVDQNNGSTTAPLTVGRSSIPLGRNLQLTDGTLAAGDNSSITVLFGGLDIGADGTNSASFDLNDGNADINFATSIASGSQLSIGAGAEFSVGGNFDNSGTLTAAAGSHIFFTGSSGSSQSLSGNFRQSNGFWDVTIESGANVDPSDNMTITNNQEVQVSGTLNVSGTYGESGGNEGADLTFDGSLFSINENADFFSSIVRFNNSGTTTVEGVVFSDVVVTNDTDVELQNAFEINGKLTIVSDGARVLLAAGRLTLNGDADISGPLLPQGGGITFEGGQLQEIAGSTTQELTFGSMVVRGSNTVVQIDNTDPRLLTDDLTIDQGGELSLGRPLEIGGNFSNDGGQFSFNPGIASGNRSISFIGNGQQTIDSETNFEFFNLTINSNRDQGSPGADVSVNSGPIEVTGTLSLDNGRLAGGGVLTLAPGASIVYGSGTITDELLADRTLNQGPEWYMLANPMGNTYDQFLRQASDGGVEKSRLWIQGPDNSEDNRRALSNLLVYDESSRASNGTDGSAWQSVEDVDNNASYGTGFIVYAYDEDRDNTGFPKTVEGRGLPNFSTSFSFPLSYTDGISADDEGWNVVGNPYAAFLDWDNLSKSSLNNTVYVWDPQNEQYQTYNGTDGTGGFEGIIAPFQGFKVQAEASDASLEVTDITTAQVTSESDPFFASEGPATSRFARLNISLGETTDMAHMTYNEEGSTGRDSYDAYRLTPLSSPSGGHVNFYTLREDGTALDINNLPFSPEEEMTIPLVAEAAGCEGSTPFEGEATMSLGETENIPETWGLFVTDTATGETHDLRADDPYTFTLSSSTDCSETSANMRAEQAADPNMGEIVTHNNEASTRFTLTLDPDAGPLPVELNNFQGQASEQSAIIEWSTASETNNAGFDVEHKAPNADSFTQVSFVEGAGTTDSPQSYSFQMDELDAGTHTFRLRQSDLDGTTTLSDPIDVEIGLSSAYELATYPNPVRDQATVQFAVQESQPVTIEVYNTLGQRVRTLFQESVPADDTREITLDVNNLSSGLYIVRMRGESFSTTQKITVVR
ncbi:hypothetical protein CRI93_13740 [Longimonas halophila]|uniref:Secretion system C-terminal sorting domain-containing protein n=1 Tax=Longimonas halophila TaxID=1469170 RepID=A0A2H3NIN9_9BACT|nr:T9SS type A sorting domain-containing protein [Longimonas halophila]PEN05076.1 hypothetical protein CRI93_13740 [Longimonas halophila]